MRRKIANFAHVMTSVYGLAEDFVRQTGCSVFLTGKAGTGKTTFLRRMHTELNKQVAVVAPTGVAAINADGVTIHSFFRLPFTPFVPTREGARNLLSKQNITAIQRRVYQMLEVLIIDEVSMVRADVLDAIDAVLRHYRYRPNEPFGGVQVIFIGDMYQLSPVVTGEEWQLLSQYYETPYFFHSQAVRQQMPVYIELDHIFRQTNRQFIDLLNEVRNNRLTSDGLNLLHMRYRPDFRPKASEGYITLTTHNKKADIINADELAKIKKKAFAYQAHITGDFPEKSYPNDELLHLKVGAKVMFIANDTGEVRRYYNGKLGTVTHLADDEIGVCCDGETETISVQPETWENIRYSVDKTTNQIVEDKLGSYTQYPLRPAWAITIHKSQGLTFDRVVIDAGSAFAPGQVYVALSRCRTLDGIVLTTPINERSLAIDEHILAFAATKQSDAVLERQVGEFKRQYRTQILQTVFDFSTVAGVVRTFVGYFRPLADDFNAEMRPFLDELERQMASVADVGERFRWQLAALCAASDEKKLLNRIEAATHYFSEQIGELLPLLEQPPAVTDSRTEATDFAERLSNIYALLAEKAHVIAGIAAEPSVDRYFALRSSFVLKPLKLHIYSGDRKAKQKLPVKNVELYKRLQAVRNDLCEEYGVPVVAVANAKMLVEMSEKMPQTADELLQIKGFGKIKVRRFGQQFIDTVCAYLRTEGKPLCDAMPFDDDKNNL